MTTTHKVLVVEDEVDLARTLTYNLQQAKFEVWSTVSGLEALRIVATKQPDVVLLDLMLPDVRGLDVCRELKTSPSTRHIPVIILTACGEEVDRVVGFEIGADDYVTKPFSVREVVLRAQAVLRRSEGPTGAEQVNIGPIAIDREGHRVHVDGQEVALTALEFRLLTTLVERRGRVQARETLLSDVWGLSISIETRTIDTHIKRLREKLGAAGRLVETVRGVGYRLMLPEA